MDENHELILKLRAVEKERDNFKYALQIISNDSETQSSGSYGMKRLAEYAAKTLDGFDWLDEFEKDYRIIELEKENDELFEQIKILKQELNFCVDKAVATAANKARKDTAKECRDIILSRHENIKAAQIIKLKFNLTD